MPQDRKRETSRSAAQSTDPIIRELENELELCDRCIKSNRQDGSLFYTKGTIYVKLFEHTKSVGYADMALEAFDKAIELTESSNVLYLADRSKLHIAMGNHELAVQDIAVMSKLPASSDIEGLYAQHTMEDIVKLDEVQASISRLSASGAIPKELEEAMNSHAKITAALVVQVDEHGHIIFAHDNRITELESIVVELKSLLESKAVLNEEEKKVILERLELIDGKLADQEARVDITELAVTELIEEWGLNQQQTQDILGRLAEIELVDHEHILAAIGHMFETMSDMELLMEARKEEEKADQELQAILADPRKSSFYYELRSELNATYMATKIVQTDIVENAKTGTVRDAASVLQIVGDGIPGVKLCSHICSNLLSAVDKKQQVTMVANYANIASSADDMDQIAISIAKSLSDGDFLERVGCEPSSDRLGMGRGFLRRTVSICLGDVEESINTVNSTAEFIDKTGRGILRKLSSDSIEGARAEEPKLGLEEPKQGSTEAEQGKIAASTIADMIIKMIYDGKIGEVKDIAIISSRIVEFVRGEYGVVKIETREESDSALTSEQSGELVVESSSGAFSVKKRKKGKEDNDKPDDDTAIDFSAFVGGGGMEAVFMVPAPVTDDSRIQPLVGEGDFISSDMEIS